MMKQGSAEDSLLLGSTDAIDVTETDSVVSTIGLASVKSGFAEATVKLANGLDLTNLRVMIDSLVNGFINTLNPWVNIHSQIHYF